MTQTEALKLALEGVEIHSPNSPEYIVCAALIKALAQTEQEPVGFYDAENKDLRREIPMGEDGDWWQLVYTTPPQPQSEARGLSQSKPLTDEEIERIRIKQGFTDWNISENAFKHVARAIEAAHGIKENT